MARGYAGAVQVHYLIYNVIWRSRFYEKSVIYLFFYLFGLAAQKRIPGLAEITIT